MKPRLLVEYGAKGGNSPKHKWLDWERDIVRREYDGHNLSAIHIAGKLGVTLSAVKGQVQQMGIAMDKSPRWNDKEIEILREMITQYSSLTIAKRLNRSVNSIVVKSKRLGISRRVRDGWFTKKEVCEILGVDHKKIQRYIDGGELKATWHTGVKPHKNGLTMWHIVTEDLKDFVKKNIGDFQGRNVDLVMIVWLVNGDL